MALPTSQSLMDARPSVTYRRRRRAATVVLAAILALSIATVAWADLVTGFKVVGHNSCELEYASNHGATTYSVETLESERSAAQHGCSGVSARARFFNNGVWTTRYPSDTTFLYDVYLNGNSTIFDYADHNGRDSQNSVWYGFRVYH